MTHLNIVPECYGDTRLVEILLQAKKVNHQQGLGTISQTLIKRFSEKRALAVVDDDKVIPPYFKEFSIQKEAPGLVLLRHKENEHFLIRICPALEKWLLDAAKEAGITSDDHPICKDLETLKSVTKHEYINKNQDFTRFLKALNRSASPRIQHLKSWLQDFVAGTL